jgi:hypothetical protein
MFRLPYNERMRFPLKSAAQFQDLDRKKLILQKKRLDLQDIHHRHLVPEISEFLLDWAEKERDDRAKELLKDRLRDAFQFLLAHCGEARPLELSDLLEVHRRVAGSEKGFFRVGKGTAYSPTLEPLEAELVVRALGRFFDWARGPGFQEMHPVEQMTIGQIRLFELQPFREFSDLTGILFPCLFLLQKGYPLPLFRPREAAEFRQAMILALESLQTAPLVALNLKGCERACDAVL